MDPQISTPKIQSSVAPFRKLDLEFLAQSHFPAMTLISIQQFQAAEKLHILIRRKIRHNFINSQESPLDEKLLSRARIC